MLSGPWKIPDYDNTQHELMMSAVYGENAQYAFSGLTQNPKASELLNQWDHRHLNFDSLEHAQSFVDVSDNTRDDHSHKTTVTPHDDGYTMIAPFVRSDKKAVGDAYKQYNVMNTLFPITYSCEEADSFLKKPKTVHKGFQEYTHCGQCWFCLERVYGFDRLF